jgi:ABC-type branched-subunit amino acid transport system substrate-binding protein
VAVAPEGKERAVYDPATARLTIYGSATRTLQVSAELDPSQLPDRGFAARFAKRFHRDPGPYAAYGYESMALVLQGIREAGTDASSFRDDVRNAVIGAHRDDTVLGSYSITSEGDTTECMIQRYRVRGSRRVPIGAPCPPE